MSSKTTQDGKSANRKSFPDETLDPRIQVELEKLNKSSEDINRLELLLDDARSTFRQVLTDSTYQLNGLSKKLGNCIEKARPYYEARVKAKEAQQDTQLAALRYERACGQLVAAKEMVNLAEQGFFTRQGQDFDPAWQEMLNHATIKVNDAEKERYESEIEHQRTAFTYCDAEHTVKQLQKQLKRNIAKSRPYFEQKAKFNEKMEQQKKLVSELEEAVVLAKSQYAEALRSLETISDEIHQQRRETTVRRRMGKRGSGVGAESPSPPRPQVESSPDDDDATSEDRPDVGLVRRTTLEAKKVDKAQNIESCNKGEGDHKRVSVSPRKDGDVYQRSQSEPTSHDEKNFAALAGGCSAKRPSSLVSVTVTRHPLSSPSPIQATAKLLPVVEFNTASSNGSRINHSRKLSETGEVFNEEDENSMATNAEVMECVQRAKTLHLLKAPIRKRMSQDDLLGSDVFSDTESLSGSIASMSVLDDDQLENLMREPGDFEQLLAKLDMPQAEKWHAMPLPAKLSYLEDFVKRNCMQQTVVAEASSAGGSSESPEDIVSPCVAFEEDNAQNPYNRVVFEKCVSYRNNKSGSSKIKKVEGVSKEKSPNVSDVGNCDTGRRADAGDSADVVVITNDRDQCTKL